jgi:ABC-type nitrate/sulfonate/bicarbonate transport system permease component
MLHPVFLPPTQEILLFLVKSIMDRTLQIHLFSSFSRAFIGLIVGTILGFLMGFLMAWFKKIDYTLDPIYELLRPIPP